MMTDEAKEDFENRFTKSCGIFEKENRDTNEGEFTAGEL
jgi:hypothetical protein